MEGSVTNWIAQLKEGGSQAVPPLWERYFAQLVALARRRLKAAPRAVADEEDVALSALDSFVRGAERGRFPKLDDRDDLWRLLVVITERKAWNLARAQRRQKRGSGQVVHESTKKRDGGDVRGLLDVPGREATPAFAALVADECRRLLAALQGENLQALALLKMEGYSNEEIAARQQCALRTVERKLRMIREIWKEADAA